ncbi:precorrin-2 C(20)-methyltransferase [Aureimonas altamirensis]|uniref:precorrin-2 C(20)-methyltransferase n=1 Tax=Aureimonas altamirensis TaxID=370622 RepID=UPI002036AE68|nr:precorrin-2 C(20)-methyltransferase [Aureimonas altamirensis]MCM2504040.1 precorrin-2 C(20)-methyltransferase [Aureimonas altamirensis]
MSGTLYGVGLGPGDPELLTLKAVRILSQVPAIAYPVPDSGHSMARAIAAPHLRPGLAEIAFGLCMRIDAAPGQAAYDAAADAIAARLQGGEDVALLCEGDPFFYGSFLYLFERLAGRFQVEIVPGISSPMAAAAAMRMPLARRNETLAVIPAPLPDAEIATRLAVADAFCIIKLGRHLARMRALLEQAGLADGSCYLSHVSTPQETIMPLCEAPATAPYFSMIVGHKGGTA